MDIDLSELPVMYLNISGNYDLDKLKHYAKIVQDKIESLKEITRVDIVGALDREIQINADIFKMQVALSLRIYNFTRCTNELDCR